MLKTNLSFLCLLSWSCLVAVIGCGKGDEAANSDPVAIDGSVQTGGNDLVIPSETDTEPEGDDSSGPDDADLDFGGDLSLDRQPKPVPSEPVQPPAGNPMPNTFEEVTFGDKYADGTVKLRWRMKKYRNGTLIKHGQYEEFHPSGNKFCEGEYSDGSRVGDWKFWHDNGKLAKRGKYSVGKPIGRWTIFREDGSVSVKESYMSGLPDGEWTYYHTDGTTILRQEHFKVGQRDGIWTEWYTPQPGEKGEPQKMASARWKDGQRHGEIIRWHSNGQQQSLMNYRNNKLHGVFKVWDRNGTLTSETEYENGNRKATVSRRPDSTSDVSSR